MAAKYNDNRVQITYLKQSYRSIAEFFDGLLSKY